MKKALVFGGHGQAGSYLVEQLMTKNYIVIAPKHSELDITDKELVEKAIRFYQPAEIYNLASIMFAPKSWENSLEVLEVNGIAVISMLEGIKRYAPRARFIQAGSADWLYTKTPYGLAKHMAQEAVAMYREKYNLHVATAIFYNMESPRRSDFFFAKKVAKEVVNYYITKQPFKIGPLDAIRDWGWAPEYMEAIQLMIAQDTPKDYIVATGVSHSCREFVEEALINIGVDIDNLFLPDYCIEEKNNETPTYMYAQETSMEILEDLQWQAKVLFKEVVKRLVQAELEKQQVKL